jgi:hypothetical protein
VGAWRSSAARIETPRVSHTQLLMMMSLFMLSVIAFAAFLPVNIHQK